MTKAGPIFVLKEMAQIDQALIRLLKSLQPADWAKQTVAPLWTVKDIVAHLLDGSIRGVSTSRDQYFGDPPRAILSYRHLVDYFNRLNADWVQAMRRVSPPMLIALLEKSNETYLKHLESLDPMGEALFSVSWAGEEKSANWFHIAREYTEKWHHQQQIRLAVGQDNFLLEEQFYAPLLDTFMRALPFHYQDVAADHQTVIAFEVAGLSQAWYLTKLEGHWNLSYKTDLPVHSTVTFDRKVAWRVFTKGISHDKAQAYVEFDGDQVLGQKILSLVAVMA